MKRQKELAVKVMEVANQETGWNFQLDHEEDVYLVGTAFRNQKGHEIAIYFLIGENMAELQVISINSKYDYEYLVKKINETALRYPVYAMGVGDNDIAIKSPILLEALDRYVANIIRRRMIDMIQTMKDIISH